MHNNIKAEEAIHYASLFSELWNASKKIITKGSDVKFRTALQMLILLEYR